MKVMSIAARAQWLAELAQAIDDAQRLAWRFGVVEGSNADALELYVRLEIARAEVEAMQGRRTSPTGSIKSLPATRPRRRNPRASGRPAAPETRPSQRILD